MKMICIKNNRGNTTYDWLKLGEEYNISYHDNDDFLVICDTKLSPFFSITFPKEWFVTIEEYRDQQINKIIPE